jgi:hypothetical protein
MQQMQMQQQGGGGRGGGGAGAGAEFTEGAHPAMKFTMAVNYPGVKKSKECISQAIAGNVPRTGKIELYSKRKPGPAEETILTQNVSLVIAYEREKKAKKPAQIMVTHSTSTQQLHFVLQTTSIGC